VLGPVRGVRRRVVAEQGLVQGVLLPRGLQGLRLLRGSGVSAAEGKSRVLQLVRQAVWEPPGRRAVLLWGREVQVVRPGGLEEPGEQEVRVVLRLADVRM
jgi:hypothetical protein